MNPCDWLITATPPTPNGDLHVGHLSGPYLAADVFQRARRIRGDSSTYVCYGDDNQSYVVTTAERLKVDPIGLMERGNADIVRTLEAYDIDMASYGRPDAAHAEAVSRDMRLLLDRGLVVERNAPQLHDPETGLPLYESFAGGRCAVCLLGTRGGICEACGHPNDPVDLLGDDLVEQRPPRGEARTVPRLVLPIEDYRDDLTAFYRRKLGTWRPHLPRLVLELLDRPLADYPMTHPGTWGIPVGTAGWEGHVINVWAEMGFGLLNALGRHKNASALQEGRYVQFLGFDNSYFFAVVHPVLQFALRRAGRTDTKLPDFIFTNEFYNLENRKFSTSQGHAIWGRDLLSHMTSDEARFYLSLHGPELAEGNFVLGDAQTALDRDIRAPLALALERLAALAGCAAAPPRPEPHPSISRAGARLRFFSEPENFSSRELASVLRNYLGYITSTAFDPTNACITRDFLDCLGFWADEIAILMPQLSADLQKRLRIQHNDS